MARTRLLTALPLLALLTACAGTTPGDAVAGANEGVVAESTTDPTPRDDDTSTDDTSTEGTSTDDTSTDDTTSENTSTDDTTTDDDPDRTDTAPPPAGGGFGDGEEHELLWDVPSDLGDWQELELESEGEYQFQYRDSQCVVSLAQPFGEDAPATAEELRDGTLKILVENLGGVVGDIELSDSLTLPIVDSNETVTLPGAEFDLEGTMEGEGYALISGRYGLTLITACGEADTDLLDDEVEDFIERLGVVVA